MSNVNLITVSYDYASTFVNSILIPQLITEIMDSGFPHRIYRIERVGSDIVITIVSDNSLTTEEQTALDNLVNAHTPALNETLEFMQLIVNGSMKGNAWVRITSFQIPDVSFDLIFIRFLASTNNGSYSLKIYDPLLNKTITEMSGITNTDLAIINMTPINFQHVSGQSIWEIHAKGNLPSSKVEVASIMIYYTDFDDY